MFKKRGKKIHRYCHCLLLHKYLAKNKKNDDDDGNDDDDNEGKKTKFNMSLFE